MRAVTTSVAFDAGWYVDANADTPDMLETALDKNEYRAGDSMTVAVTARTAGRLTLNVIGDKLLATQTEDIKAGVAQIKVTVGADWGTGAYHRRHLAASAGRAGAADAGPRHRRAVVCHRPRREDARPSTAGAAAVAAEHELARAGQSRRSRSRRGGRALRSLRSMSASSI